MKHKILLRGVFVLGFLSWGFLLGVYVRGFLFGGICLGGFVLEALDRSQAMLLLDMLFAFTYSNCPLI